VVEDLVVDRVPDVVIEANDDARIPGLPVEGPP
jgi:hypothetical protein